MPIDKRLRWRCRRGTREMDLILDRFLSLEGSTLDRNEEISLGRLLDVTDRDILDWLAGRATPPPDPGLVAILRRIKASSGGSGVLP